MLNRNKQIVKVCCEHHAKTFWQYTIVSYTDIFQITVSHFYCSFCSYQFVKIILEIHLPSGQKQDRIWHFLKNTQTKIVFLWIQGKKNSSYISFPPEIDTHTWTARCDMLHYSIIYLTKSKPECWSSVEESKMVLCMILLLRATFSNINLKAQFFFLYAIIIILHH